MPLRKRQKIQEMLLSLIPASGCQSNPRQGLLALSRMGRSLRTRVPWTRCPCAISCWPDGLSDLTLAVGKIACGSKPRASTWGMATKYSLSCRELSISRATSCFLVEHKPRPIEVGGDEVVVGKHVARVPV